MTETTKLISPYKGDLVDLVVSFDERSDVFNYATGLRSVQLMPRQTCDLELLATGAFSPLCGFMAERDYNYVLDEMRLADGTVFPIPITLGVDDITSIHIGSDIGLRDLKNELLGVLRVSEIFEWDRERFVDAVCGTADPRHPLVSGVQSWGRFNLSGTLRVLKLPEHHDFAELRLTPKETRERLEALGRSNVVAFQTRNPMHRAHEAITQKAIEITDGSLLLHPVVGMTKEGDIDYSTRVRTYKAISEIAYPKNRVVLSLLPLAMRMAGPREAVWHAIIRRNYGASHLIVGRDHASPGLDATGKPFYEPYAARSLATELSAEVGVEIVPIGEFAFLPDEKRYEEVDKIAAGKKYFPVSGNRIRDDLLSRNKQLPEWLVRKEVAKILSDSYPPRHRQGFCLWFTGLSGSGKTTTAEIVTALLLEEGRQTTLLDGDVVRTNLSKGLGFSKEDRDINIRRIGFVASEIVRHDGIAVCAAVSPYRASRNQVRQMFREGHFIEVFVDTPFEVCEKRDTKGLYAKARRGELLNFTGIDDVYEIPESAELTIETVDRTARENAILILEVLRSKGFLKPLAQAVHEQ